MKIYLVRHPETIANRDGIVYGWMDYPYTEVGQEMARRIPSYFRGLEIDAVYSSPLGRARRLAEGIGQETGRSVQTDDRLKEMNFGVLEGTLFDKLDPGQREILDRLFADFENFRIPGGESGSMIRERADSFFRELLEDEPRRGEYSGVPREERPRERTIVVVAHAMLIQMVLVSLLELDITKAWNFRMKPGMIIRLKARQDYTGIDEILNYETLFPTLSEGSEKT